MTGALIPNYARYDVEFERGEGVRLWDAEGNEYLDFLSGIAVCNTGHCHPQVVAAVQEQAARLLHVSNLFYTAPMVRLAERLAARSLGGKVFFANSGAEANEAALKLARKRRRGGRFVVLHGGFHGRTFGALSATPQETKQAPFAPLVPGFDAVLPEAAPAAVGPRHRGRRDRAGPGRVGRAPAARRARARDPRRLRRARRAADPRRGPDRDGAHRHAVGLRALRDRPRRDDAGQGPRRRAADRRARHRAGATPTSSRPATTARPSPATRWSPPPPTPRSTSSTTPPSSRRCASAATLLVEGVRELPRVTDVRGAGLMVAAELELDAPALVRRALVEQRLVLNATGPRTLRFLPPLVVTEAEIADALGRLRALLA